MRCTFLKRIRRVGVGVATLALACAPEEPSLPPLPDGAELVLEVGDLSIYRAFDGMVCPGSLRRIEAHALALAELFGRAPPRARLLLYMDQSSVDEVCRRGVRGCSQGWGGHALPAAATHELAHIFVLNSTEEHAAWPFAREGIAQYLDGNAESFEESDGAQSADELRSFLVSPSATKEGFPVREARYFFGWAIAEFGVDAVVRAEVITGGAALEDVPENLASALGFDSVDQLYERHLESRAAVYPRFPNTSATISAADLQSGVMFDTSCEGGYAEGPSDGLLHTAVRLEIPVAGEYAVEHGALPVLLPEDRPQLLPDEPVTDPGLFFDLGRPADCSVTDPPRFLFHVPGNYLLEYETPTEEPFSTVLSLRYVGDECSGP